MSAVKTRPRQKTGRLIGMFEPDMLAAAVRPTSRAAARISSDKTSTALRIRDLGDALEIGHDSGSLQITARTFKHAESPQTAEIQREFFVPTTAFTAVCQTLGSRRGHPVSLYLDRTFLHISAGLFDARIPTTNDFPFAKPPFDVTETKAAISMPPAVMRHLLSKTMFAMAHADKPSLAGIALSTRYTEDGPSLQLTATNTAIMATSKVDHISIGIDYSHLDYLMIPALAVASINDIVSMAQDEIRIHLHAGAIAVSSPYDTVICPLSATNYPDISRIIPPASTQRICIDARRLSAAIARSSPGSGNIRSVLLEPDETGLGVRSNTSETESHERLETEDQRNDRFRPLSTIRLNANLLQSILARCDRQTELQISSPTNVVMIENPGELQSDDAFTCSSRYLLMPMSL